jgi:hypothetical protein
MIRNRTNNSQRLVFWKRLAMTRSCIIRSERSASSLANWDCSERSTGSDAVRVVLARRLAVHFPRTFSADVQNEFCLLSLR